MNKYLVKIAASQAKSKSKAKPSSAKPSGKPGVPKSKKVTMDSLRSQFFVPKGKVEKKKKKYG